LPLPYYSQRTVFASPLSAFSLSLFYILRLSGVVCQISTLLHAEEECPLLSVVLLNDVLSFLVL